MSHDEDEGFGDFGNGAKGLGDLFDGLWKILVWFLRCFVFWVIPFAVYMHKLSKKREEERKQEERNQLNEERRQLEEERKQFEEQRKRTTERGFCHSPFDDNRRA
jgi:flagellar biosynthesis/type III secretory pathway M-ring protein FliF/YscJ